jgi:hypothetical protein
LRAARLVFWCCVCAGAAFAQEPPPESAIAVTLGGAAASGEVEFGVPFEATAVRSWPEGERPEPWDDAALAPLAVVPLDVRAETREGRVIETRAFRAHAFRRGAVALPRAALFAADGAPLQLLVVDSALPEGDDGTAELPEAPALAIWPARRELAGALIAALAAGVTVWVLGRAARALRARSRRAPDPAALARARIAALRGAVPATRAAQRAEALALTALARELLPGAAPEERAALEDVLARADAVKFAAAEMAPAERARALDALEASVR